MKFIYSATLAGALLAAAGIVIFQKFGSAPSAISKTGPSSVMLMGKNLGLQRTGQRNLPGNSLVMTV